MLFAIQLLLFSNCFISVSFASQPLACPSKPMSRASATAVQPVALSQARCDVRSHANTLAREKAIANAVNEPGKEPRLLPPLIQIIASYCEMPVYFKKQCELLFPQQDCQRYVNSIAQLSPQKIAVSYTPALDKPVGERTVQLYNEAAIWDLQQQNPTPDIQTLDEIPRDVLNDFGRDASKRQFIGLSERFMAVCGDGINNDFLYDIQTKSQSDIIKADGPYQHSRIISLVKWEAPVKNSTDGYCAVLTSTLRFHTVLIPADSSQCSMIIPLLPAGIRGNLADMKKYRDLLNTIITICALPNQRLAVGTREGKLAIVKAMDSNGTVEWDDYTVEKKWREDQESIRQIVAWPNGMIAVLMNKYTSYRLAEGIIQCWDTHTKKKFNPLKLNTSRVVNICALPNGRLAASCCESESAAGVESPVKVQIYTIVTDAYDDSATCCLEQELSFYKDYITSFPFFLAQSTPPAMAIGMSSGSVQIWQESVCPDCESTKKNML